MRSHDVLNGLNSVKFLEIVNSNETPNIFSTYQLKITFKRLSFARKPFLMSFEIRTPLGLKHLNFRIFSFFLHRKYPTIYINNKTSYFKPLREVESRFKIVYFFYTPCMQYIYVIKIDLNIKQDDR